MSYFRGQHVQSAPFMVQWVNDALSGLALSMTEESTPSDYKIPRIGDYVGRVALVIRAPLLASVSVGQIDGRGWTDVAANANNPGAQRMLVDDLPHTRAGIQRSTLSHNGTGFASKMYKLSMYLDSVQSSESDGHPVLTASGITFPTAFEAGRDFFPAEDAAARYCRFAPMHIIKEVHFRISTQVTDTVTSMAILAYHCMWTRHQLAGECVHDSTDTSVLRAWSTVREREWIVMLPFWWVHSPAQYMPARAWNNHELTLTPTFNALGSVIVGSPDHVDVLTSFPTAAENTSTFVCRTTVSGKLGAFLTAIGNTVFPATEINASHFGVCIRYERIHAPPHEREQLHGSSGEMVFVTHKQEKLSLALSNSQLTATGTEVHIAIQPKLSVAGFLFGIHRTSQLKQNKRLSYSGVPSPLFALDGDVEEAQNLLSNVRLELNADALFSEDYVHLHRMQPASHGHSAQIPAGLMYRSFGEGNPYGLQKKGSLAFAAVDDKDLYLLPNANAAASHVDEGGVSGESGRFDLLSYVYNTISWSDGMATKDWH